MWVISGYLNLNMKLVLVYRFGTESYGLPILEKCIHLALCPSAEIMQIRTVRKTEGKTSVPRPREHIQYTIGQVSIIGVSTWLHYFLIARAISSKKKRVSPFEKSSAQFN